MKTLVKISMLLLVLTLVSCRSGFNNFNKQKFTGLKGIKPTYAQEQDVDQNGGVLNEANDPNDNAIVDVHSVQQDNPNVTQLKQAIENDFQIIVNVRGEKFWLKGAIYDGIYEALTGVLVPVTDSDLDPTFYEVNASEYSERLGSNKVFSEHISSVTKKNYYANSGTVKETDDIEGIEQPENEIEDNVDSEETSVLLKDKTSLEQLNLRFPQKKSPMAESILEGSNYTYKGDYINPHYRAGRRNFRASLVFLFPLAIGIIFMITSWSLFFAGMIITGIAVLVGLIFLLRSAIALKRLKREIGAERFRKLPRARAMRTLGILGLLLFGCFPFLIPFLIFMGIVSGQSKRVAHY